MHLSVNITIPDIFLWFSINVCFFYFFVKRAPKCKIKRRTSKEIFNETETNNVKTNNMLTIYRRK